MRRNPFRTTLYCVVAATVLTAVTACGGGSSSATTTTTTTRPAAAATSIAVARVASATVANAGLSQPQSQCVSQPNDQQYADVQAALENGIVQQSVLDEAQQLETVCIVDGQGNMTIVSATDNYPDYAIYAVLAARQNDLAVSNVAVGGVSPFDAAAFGTMVAVDDSTGQVTYPYTDYQGSWARQPNSDVYVGPSMNRVGTIKSIVAGVGPNAKKIPLAKLGKAAVIAGRRIKTLRQANPTVGTQFAANGLAQSLSGPQVSTIRDIQSSGSYQQVAGLTTRSDYATSGSNVRERMSTSRVTRSLKSLRRASRRR